MMMTLFAFLFSSVAALASETHQLVLGEEWVLKGHHRIWISSEKVLSARASGASVILKGKAEGTADVRMGAQLYSVRVVSPTAHQVEQLLHRRVSALAGLEFSWDGAKPIVMGRLHHLEAYFKLSENLPKGSEWEFRAEIPERLRHDFEARLQERLGPEAPVRPLMYGILPTTLFNGTPAAAERWKIEFARWGLGVQKDDAAVEMAPIVRVEIAIAEIRKNYEMNVGLKWPTGNTGTNAATANLVPGSGLVFSNMVFAANALEAQGWGRLLARPNLLCRSGKEAEFVAGGEFPIKIFNYKIQDVVWKRYGIVLKVKPKADLSGRISLSLETEVSSIDKANAVDGIPGILTNKVISQFDLTRSRTIALSGLLREESSSSREGLPGLSGLPIIGALFGSKDWQDRKTELVVFVRPSIEKEP